MPKIFISYRRDDSIETAGRIYDQLAGHFGSENVFMDDYTIPPGVDFRKHLHDAVGGCDVVLAVIGRDWMKRRGLLRKRRLDDPGDFVRIEIEAALQRDVRVVPVLVRDATMPRPGDLPASIRDFAYRHAVRIRAGRDFRTDIDRLIGALQAVSPQPEAPSYSPPQSEAPPPEPLPPDVPPRVHEGALPAAPGPLTEPPMVAPAGEVVQAGEITTNSIGMKMVLIPAGEFLMGSPDSDNDASDDEKPQHRVKITRPFYLGVFPVTQDEYERVMRKTPSRFKGDPRRPVEMVSWTYAMEFCHRLSEKEDKQYRLPTEAEWEYACRAGSTTKWCFGDSESLLGEYAWYFDNSDQATHPVGQKKANAWGLYDMHGNVSEWCADWYHGSYDGHSPPSDPEGPSSSSHRVYRGGSWLDDAWHCRSAYRNDRWPGDEGSYLGFRVSLVPADESSK